MGKEKSVYIPLSKVASILELDRHTLYYRIEHNVNDIGKFIKIVHKEDKNNKTYKQYLFHISFLDEIEKYTIEKVTEEDMEEFRELYYKVISCYEKELEESGRSIATEERKWLDMSLVDVELCGEIFSRYKKENGVRTVGIKLKRAIRGAIEDHIIDKKNIYEVVVSALERSYEENCCEDN